MTFAELQRITGLNRSTLHRYLVTLMDHGYMDYNPGAGLYRLGIRFFELGAIVMKNMDLKRVAVPFLKELAEKLNETVHIVVREGIEGIYVEKFEPPGAMVTFSLVGKRLPLYCTAVGKVLLAFLDETERADLLTHLTLERRTRKTITDKEQLKAHLEEVYNLGYAVDDEELEEGLICVAVPIFGQAQKIVAALSVSGAAHRIKAKLVSADSSLITLLQKVAVAISRQLGYMPEHKA
jgi:DNA-binding IclR family transcriptional regulator